MQTSEIKTGVALAESAKIMRINVEMRLLCEMHLKQLRFGFSVTTFMLNPHPTAPNALFQKTKIIRKLIGFGARPAKEPRSYRPGLVYTP